jgi:hypothetical protein
MIVAIQRHLSTGKGQRQKGYGTTAMATPYDGCAAPGKSVGGKSSRNVIIII